MTEQNDNRGRGPLSDTDRRRLLVACGATIASSLTGCVGGARDPRDDGARNGQNTGGDGKDEETPQTPDGEVPAHLDALGLEGGTDYEPDGYAVVVYSESEPDTVQQEADELSSEFDRYGTHGKTMVEEYENVVAVVSLWDDKDAADIAEGFLVDIDGVFESVSGPLNGTEAAEEAGDEEGMP